MYVCMYVRSSLFQTVPPSSLARSKKSGFKSCSDILIGVCRCGGAQVCVTTPIPNPSIGGDKGRNLVLIAQDIFFRPSSLSPFSPSCTKRHVLPRCWLGSFKLDAKKRSDTKRHRKNVNRKLSNDSICKVEQHVGKLCR